VVGRQPSTALLNTWQFWDARIGGWWSNNESAGLARPSCAGGD